MSDYLPCYIIMRLPDDADRSKTGGETRQTSHKHITGAHVPFNKLGIYQDYPKINPQSILYNVMYKYYNNNTC